MKKLITTVVLYLSCIGILPAVAYGENKVEELRKKTDIKLFCQINKVHIIKTHKGRDVDIILNKKEIEKNNVNYSPILIEFYSKGKPSIIWIDKIPIIGSPNYSPNEMFYLNENDYKSEQVIINMTFVDHEKLKLYTEASMPIEKNDNRYNYGPKNKPPISSKKYGTCNRI